MPTPSIDGILDFFDESVANGTLEGEWPRQGQPKTD